jgi:hypothetical protein
MRPRVAIWLALLAAHAGVFALGWVVGSDWLATIVVSSIYLPLWPLGKLGIPVISQSGWIFPPPTVIGWVAIIVCWSLLYWGVAIVAARLLARRNRAA